MDTQMTGYPSIDKPWLKYYPEVLFAPKKQYNKVIDYIRDTWAGAENDTMIHYYGSDVTAKEFFDMVESCARSLKAMGIQKDDTIITNLDAVPEFIYLFFAAETIGVNVKNKIGAGTEEIAEIVNESNAKSLFVHDYMTHADTSVIYENIALDHIIVVNPLEYSHGDMSGLRPHIKAHIQGRYIGECTHDSRNIPWRDFLKLGESYGGEVYVPSDENTRLFSAYTSGSTGARKEVIHSSKTILEMLDQMIFPTEPTDTRESWFWPIYPPSLVAAIVAYLCMPLAQGKLSILDPYFDYQDIDLELMHYKPNSTGFVPVFFESMIESKRIPEDYDMSHMKVLGFGAESLPRNLIARIENFTLKHNCHAQLNGGFGNSEGGSEMTIAFTNQILMTGSAGIPLIHTVVSIFEPGTEKELKYGEVGEICKCGPGIMLGYANPEDTAKTVWTHTDGSRWLHTGDLGYMTPEGFLFVFGREGIHVHPGKTIYPLIVENKISDIPGVQNAIIVSGDSREHTDFQAAYLFIVPFQDVNHEEFMANIEEKLRSVLQPEEMPEKVWLLDSKPVTHFKVDRKWLRKEYGITESK